MTEIRIAIVDDHGLFRESLGRLLESAPGFRIVARCATSSEAHELLAKTPADVVLLDYDLGDESALPLLRELRQRSKERRVLMVTAGISDHETLQVMEAGASGIFLKHDDPEHLITAIQRIVSG